MKINSIQRRICLGWTALSLVAGAGTAWAQMSVTNVIQTFDVDDSANHWGNEWGPGQVAWDGNEGLELGALLITTVLTQGQDTPTTSWICKFGNPWWNGGETLNFSSYDNLEFDLKWDNTSDLTIGQFNDYSTIPPDATNQLGQNILRSGQGSLGGIVNLDVALCGGPGGQMAPVIGNIPIPAEAAAGWVHIKIPINKSQSQIDGVTGIVFHKWVNNNGAIENDAQARFWIDNVILTGTEAEPPPPVVRLPAPATKGLNIFTSAGGLYDRQSVVLRQDYGLSWVGQATAENPVTYAFTIAGYPNSVDCEAWLFLVPNPDYLHSAPDWNATNCVKIRLQGSATNGVMQFQYKVNEDHQQAMYYGGEEARGAYTNAPGSWDGVTPNYLESGFLGQVTSDTILGQWQVKFTSDTAITLIAPNGATAAMALPAYNVNYFAEQTAPGFYVYLGLQANDANAFNQALVIADFAITGTISPYSENFLTDTELDTANIWNTSASPAPSGVFLITDPAASWVMWTLPDPGFNLQIAGNLANPAAWTDPVTGPVLSMNGVRAQLVAGDEIPAGNAAFFRLIKRKATQLQVLLPGETNAPNTPTGKTGTPAPVLFGDFTTVTINAVDDTFHIARSTTGSIHLTSSDPYAILPMDASLVNGTLEQVIQFGNLGTWTVTATNTSSETMPEATSSEVNVVSE